MSFIEAVMISVCDPTNPDKLLQEEFIAGSDAEYCLSYALGMHRADVTLGRAVDITIRGMVRGAPVRWFCLTDLRKASAAASSSASSKS